MIRHAVPDDATAISEVFLAARAGMAYLPELHTDGETRAFIRDVVVRTQEVLVFEEEGVQGFAAFDNAMLDHLYVAPEAQGKGVGSALLDEVKRHRPNGFEFWVFQANEGACRFYERHGCHVGQLGDGSENEEGLPDALYRWP